MSEQSAGAAEPCKLLAALLHRATQEPSALFCELLSRGDNTGILEGSSAFKIIQLCILDSTHYSSGLLIPALLSDFQPITCHNIKEVRDSRALCLRLNESHTCVSAALPLQWGGTWEVGRGHQGWVLHHLLSGGDGITVLGVGLGWRALHFHP